VEEINKILTSQKLENLPFSPLRHLTSHRRDVRPGVLCWWRYLVKL